MLSYNKTLSRVLFGLLFLVTSGSYAQDSIHQRDFEIVESYLISKRTLPLVEKEKYFKFAGDIRAQYLYRQEIDQFGREIRGDERRPTDTYEAQLNLKLDYKCEDRTWGQAYWQFHNDMGVEDMGVVCELDPEACTGSGVCDDLCLKRAYYGINIFRKEKLTLDLEAGRRPLYIVYDSRIQFHGREDGIVIKYSDYHKENGDWYIKGGPFVVDYRINHYAFVMELGWLDFMRKGWDFKYSYIDWVLNGRNRCGVKNPRGWQFRNSQFTFGYNFIAPYIKKKAKIYGAFLINADAKKRVPLIEQTDPNAKASRENIGWYFGFIIGEVSKKGDWSFDANYQYVEAQAINDCDIHGIGRGNARGESFTRENRGKANYHGMQLEALYAITDKLQLDIDFEFSNEINRRFGGLHRFQKFELDLIHAF